MSFELLKHRRTVEGIPSLTNRETLGFLEKVKVDNSQAETQKTKS